MEYNFYIGFIICILFFLFLVFIICICVGICFIIFVIWEIIFILCFCICNCFKVFIVMCRVFIFSDLKFLLINNDFIFIWLEDKEDKFNVKVRDIKKDFLFEREWILCILFIILRFIICKVSVLGMCCSL